MIKKKSFSNTLINGREEDKSKNLLNYAENSIGIIDLQTGKMSNDGENTEHTNKNRDIKLRLEQAISRISRHKGNFIRRSDSLLHKI